MSQICFGRWRTGWRFFETIIAHTEGMLTARTLPKTLKELVIVRASQLNRTPYCLALNTTICRKLGWTDVQLDALPETAGSEEFREREKAAIHPAEVMTLDVHSFDDPKFSQLRSFSARVGKGVDGGCWALQLLQPV